MASAFDLPREYVLLGLRFDRLEAGFVDAYTGDPALKVLVADEAAPVPAALAARARELAAELPSAGLPADRTAFLAGQLRGLEVSGRALAGEVVSYVDEVEAYFQVRPTLGDEAAYADAHAALDDLLPGSGSLRERYLAERTGDELPPEQLRACVLAFSSALRDQVRTAYGLPEAETVDYQVVTDQPWSGFNYYLGDYRSTVAINADLPMRRSSLPSLVAHESYPGHHTEHCRKERLLVEGGGRLEHTIFLVNTPECLMAEGLADLGVRATVGEGWGRWAQEIFADLGQPFDGERAAALAKATAALDGVRQDAALLLHDRAWAQDDVVDYLQRWSLMPPERALKSLDFLTHPLWRAYITTYVEGYRLLSGWLDARPAGSQLPARYARLLDEPLTPAAIRAELSTAGATGTG
ncbi:MAG: hypothetical protein NVSMB13_16750 [Mycobacteriales bacterium]